MDNGKGEEIFPYLKINADWENIIWGWENIDLDNGVGDEYQ